MKLRSCEQFLASTPATKSLENESILGRSESKILRNENVGGILDEESTISNGRFFNVVRDMPDETIYPIKRCAGDAT